VPITAVSLLDASMAPLTAADSQIMHRWRPQILQY